MAMTALEEILARLHQAQSDLDREVERLLEDGRARFRYTLEAGRVVFEQQVRRLHLAQRTRVWPFLRSAPFAFILSAPLIYGMVIPLVILDVSITVFQHLCFRIYGIPRVRRGDYLVIDRHKLAYLNGIERLNCVYCGYSNQLLEYAREVAGRTEQFWCPIKHARRTLDPHRRTSRFVDYGDAEAYTSELPRLRRDWGDATSALGSSAARPDGPLP